MTRLSIDISDELHHLLKVHTAWTKSNIRDFVTEAIHNKIEFNEIYQESEDEGFKVDDDVLRLERTGTHSDIL